MIFGGGQAVGLDIGTTSIKMVELKKAGKYFKLVKFGMSPIPEGLVEGGEIQDPAALASHIYTLHKDMGLRSKKICVGVFGGAVIVKKISMPKIDSKLVGEQIKWEAEQYIPFDLSEVSLDFHILGSSGSAETMDLLLVAAKQEYLIRYFEAIETAGLRCSVIDVNGFALANSFELNYGARRTQTVAIINIGGGVSNLVIIDKGEVVFCRDIPIGGSLYNMEIARELGVSNQEADELKIGAAHSAESPPELLNVMSQTNEMICEEIRNSFEFYQSSNSGPDVDEIFLSGGTVNIRQLVEAISDATQKSCQVFNPLQSITYNKKEFSQEYLSQIQMFLPAVLGLGMRKSGG